MRQSEISSALLFFSAHFPKSFSLLYKVLPFSLYSDHCWLHLQGKKNTLREIVDQEAIKMASSTSCLRLENVIFSSTYRKLRQTNANGSVLLSSPIRSFSLLSSSSLFSPKFALLKNLHSVSSSLSVKASSSTAIAEPEGIKVLPFLYFVHIQMYVSFIWK